MLNKKYIKEKLKNGEEIVVTHKKFSDNEFLYINKGEIHDEEGYRWTIEDLDKRPEEGWSLWLDLDNLITEKIDMPRNKKCKCGSGKKFKKCCWLTQNKLIAKQNKKLKKVFLVIEAIKNKSSVREILRANGKKYSELSGFIQSQFNNNIFIK